VIGQAKGVLMEREGIAADEAFDVLRRASQRLNVKLRDVADKVITGDDRTAQPQVVDPVPIGGALTSILEAAQLLPPDRLPELTLDVAAASGARNVRIFLVEHSQRRLLPLADATAAPFEVDG